MVLPFSRAGVPVFKRPTLSPRDFKYGVIPLQAASPTRPPGVASWPTNITPFRKVPVVRTTAAARNSVPSASVTPFTLPLPVNNPSTAASMSVRLSWFCNVSSIYFLYKSRSAWARGPRTAGPFEAFNIRNCMPDLSMTRPISPSSASISRTKCPLPKPPMAGLQDMAPIVFKRCVISAVDAPIRAAAAQASQPAWPPPTTITSKKELSLIKIALLNLFVLLYHQNVSKALINALI